MIKVSASEYAMVNAAKPLLPILRKYRLPVPILDASATLSDFKQAVLMDIEAQLDEAVPRSFDSTPLYGKKEAR